MNDGKVKNPLAKQLLEDIENDCVLRAKDIAAAVHSLDAEKQELVEALRGLANAYKSLCELTGSPFSDPTLVIETHYSRARALLSKHGGTQ